MKLFQAKKLVKLIELISINFLNKKKSEFYIDLFNFTNFPDVYKNDEKIAKSQN